MVMLVDPVAIRAILKRPLYVPKPTGIYSFFQWLVRGVALVLQHCGPQIV